MAIAASISLCHAAPFAVAIRATTLIGGTGQELVSLNLATGAMSTIGAISSTVGLISLAVGPGGELFAAGFSSDPLMNLYQVDLLTAAVTLVGPTGPEAIYDLDFQGNTLLGSNGTLLYSIQATTGIATVLSTTQRHTQGLAAIDANSAYVAYFPPLSDAALGKIDLATGSISHIGQIGASFGNVTGLDIGADGQLYALTAIGQLLRIDSGTGAGTLISQSDYLWYALAALPDNPTPEPATASLLILSSAIGLAGHRLRKSAGSQTEQPSLTPSRPTRPSGCLKHECGRPG